MGTDGKEKGDHKGESKIYDVLIEYQEGKLTLAKIAKIFKLNMGEMSRFIKYMIGENEWKKLQAKRRETVRRKSRKWEPI